MVAIPDRKSQRTQILDRMKELPNDILTVDLLDQIVEISGSEEVGIDVINKLIQTIRAEDRFSEIKINLEKLILLYSEFPIGHDLGSRLLSIVVENLSVSSFTKKKQGTYYTLSEDAELISLLSSFRFFQRITHNIPDESLLDIFLSKSCRKENLSLISNFPFEISILDPSCGTGSFLVQITRLIGHLGPMYNKKMKISIWGMDLDQNAILVTKLRLLLLELFLAGQDALNSIEINITLLSGDFLLEKFDRKFDIIIGNPPYVRHEDIGMYHSPDYKDILYKKFSSFLESNILLDRKSDYLIYFCLKSLNLLNSNGVLAFLTSNAWLEVNYGKTLQDHLISMIMKNNLTFCEIIHQSGSRFWKHLGINSIIFLASKSSKEDVLSGKIYFTESIRDLNEISKTSLKNGLFFCKEFASDDYRTEAISIEELKTSNKWAGNFLRASKEERILLRDIKGQGVSLSTIANVQFGIKTGANDFFHVSVDKPSENEILVKMKNKTGFIGKMEAEFLSPLIKSPVECEGYVVPIDFIPKVWLFNCRTSLEQLESTGALLYIKWGEKESVTIKQGKKLGTIVKGYHKLKSLSQRELWYSLPAYSIPDLLWTKSYHNKPGCLLNQAKCLPDQRFYGISVHDPKSIPIIFTFLNSSFIWAQMEHAGNTNMGFGVLDTNVYWLKTVKIPTCLSNEQEQALERIYKKLVDETSRTVVTVKSSLREEIDNFFAKVLGVTEEELDLLFQFIKKNVKNRLAGNTKDN
jgi:hypothetical protein